MKRAIPIILIMGLFAIRGYCQDNQVADNQNTAQTTQTAAQTTLDKANQSKELSVYGEVKSINSIANSMIIEYYDYDNDEEKSIEIIADNNTKMENASNIGDVKKGDWADITYAVIDGKNIAKLISIEKEEAPAETSESEESQE